MQTAAVSEIKASLSEYLGKVKAGEDIMITERGRPIARIIPLRRDQQAAAQLEHLEKRGLVKIGNGGLPDDFWSMNRPLDSGAMGLAALLEERDGGR
jgi:prevent-host-death family protein